jgi:hypothetical protein
MSTGRNWILQTDLRAEHGEQAVAAHNVLVSGPEAAEFRLGLLPEDLAGVAVIVYHHVHSSEDQLDVRTVVPSFAQLLPAPLHDTYRNNRIPLFNLVTDNVNYFGKAVFRICHILRRIRIRILGSVPYTRLRYRYRSETLLLKNISFFSFFFYKNLKKV